MRSLKSLPVLCILLAAPAAADELAEVNAAFLATYADLCNGLFLEDGRPAYPPDIYPVTYRTSWEADGEAPHEMRIYRYTCQIGAYNTAHVFFTDDDRQDPRTLTFAMPTYSIVYEPGTGPDGVDDTKVREVAITGMTSEAMIVNSEIDAEAGTISTISHWRGVGDASSLGKWMLVDGTFALVRYEIDASYDGEVNRTAVWNTEAAAAAQAEALK